MTSGYFSILGLSDKSKLVGIVGEAAGQAEEDQQLSSPRALELALAEFRKALKYSSNFISAAVLSPDSVPYEKCFNLSSPSGKSFKILHLHFSSCLPSSVSRPRR